MPRDDLSEDRKTACDTAYMAGVNSAALRLAAAEQMAQALRLILPLFEAEFRNEREAQHAGVEALAAWEQSK